MRRTAYIGWIGMGIIAVSLLVLRVYALRYPDAYIADEFVYVDTARAILRGRGYMFDHPGFFPFLIATAIGLFGDHPWVWRLPAALVTMIAPISAYWIARRLQVGTFLAVTVALLVLVDPFLGMYTRSALPDGIIASIAMVVLAISMPQGRWGWGRVAAIAGLIGLAAATKYNGAWIIIVPVCALFVQRSYSKVLGLMAITGLTYMAVTGGVTALAHGEGGSIVTHWLAWQRYSIFFHTHQDAEYWYASRWYTWPLGIVPVQFWKEEGAGGIRTIMAVPNLIALWLGAGVVALGVGETLNAWVRHQALIGWRAYIPYAVIGYLGTYLPWVLITRPSFFYHYLPAYLIGLMFLGITLAQVIQERGWKVVGGGLLLALMGVSLYFTPIAYGIPELSQAQAASRVWLWQWNDAACCNWANTQPLRY